MSLIQEPTVPGETTPAEVAPATQAAGGVASATPSQSPQVDAAALLLEKHSLELDINKLKSTFQKREGQLQQEAKQREAALKEELERLKVSGMDDDSRKLYEAEIRSRNLQQKEQELDAARKEYEDLIAFTNAQQQFALAGVPAESLRTDGDLNDLVQSGWDWILTRNKSLEEENQKLKTSSPTAPVLPSAPPVALSGPGASLSTKPTWDDLVKRYGNRETVYQLVEQGRLPSTIIP